MAGQTLESLARVIMYGADKIPDSWFEKVPGGFYKRNEQPNKSSTSSNYQQQNSDRGRALTKDSDGRRRRDSVGEAFRSPHTDDSKMYDEGYRSDGQGRGYGRRRAERNSYDGAENDQDSVDGRRGRTNRGGNDDRYGYDDGYGRSRNTNNDRDRQDEYDDRRGNGRGSKQNDDPNSGKRQQYPSAAPYSPSGFTSGGAGGNAPYPNSVPQSPKPSQSSPPPSSSRNQSSGGYVPYSHIYGQPNQNQSRQHKQQSHSPQPPSSGSDSREQFQRKVAPPPWKQNADAQQAPTAAAAGAGAEYTGQPGFINTEVYEPRQHQGQEQSRHRDDDRYDDRNSGYDEDEGSEELSRPSYSPPPIDRHHRRHASKGRRGRSPSPNRHPNDRHRPSQHHRRAKSHGAGGGGRAGGKVSSGGGAKFKGKARILSYLDRPEIKDNLDTSRSGIASSTFGAVAGGLLGSEIHKGYASTAIGAAVGALGANAFEARERYVDNIQTPERYEAARAPRERAFEDEAVRRRARPGLQSARTEMDVPRRAREGRRFQIEHPQELPYRRHPGRYIERDHGYYSD